MLRGFGFLKEKQKEKLTFPAGTSQGCNKAEAADLCHSHCAALSLGRGIKCCSGQVSRSCLGKKESF